jgi:hypothetical protein
VIVLLPPKVLLFIQNLSHILDKERPRLDCLLRKQPKAFHAGPPDLEFAVLLALEALVFALLAAGAVSGDALHVEHAIQAFKVLA